MIAAEENRVTRERADRGERLRLSVLRKYRQYNRIRLEDWLGSWASTSKGNPKAHPDELITRSGFGPQGPGGISMARLESLLSEDIKITDRLLQGVVDELREFRPRAYRNLIPVYFDEYASEGILEQWRRSDNDTKRVRAVSAEVAIKWMLLEVERRLADLGRKRLVVLAPWASTQTAMDLVAAEQRYAVDLYFKKLDEAERWAAAWEKSQKWARKVAIRRTISNTGYSRQWIYKLIQPLKSDSTLFIRSAQDRS